MCAAFAGVAIFMICYCWLLPGKGWMSDCQRALVFGPRFFFMWFNLMFYWQWYPPHFIRSEQFFFGWTCFQLKYQRKSYTFHYIRFHRFTKREKIGEKLLPLNLVHNTHGHIFFSDGQRQGAQGIDSSGSTASLLRAWEDRKWPKKPTKKKNLSKDKSEENQILIGFCSFHIITTVLCALSFVTCAPHNGRWHAPGIARWAAPRVIFSFVLILCYICRRSSTFL